MDIPGKVVDVLADPKRNVYYVLRQDKNQVLVFNAANNTQTATLRTCTTPTGMAITFDQQYLLVGCDNSHYMSVFDLDLLQAQPPIALPLGLRANRSRSRPMRFWRALAPGSGRHILESTQINMVSSTGHAPADARRVSERQAGQ